MPSVKVSVFAVRPGTGNRYWQSSESKSGIQAVAWEYARAADFVATIRALSFQDAFNPYATVARFTTGLTRRRLEPRLVGYG